LDRNLEELVKAYLTIRTERETLKSQYEVNDKVLLDDMDALEKEMLVICNDTNASSIRTGSGTVIRKLNERFTTNDWDNFKKFVIENDAVDLLERRIHQGNFKQFMAEHEQDGLPPGVNVMREFGIVVRKPSN
jgi:deoxyxylulose-5-phosphate synthase